MRVLKNGTRKTDLTNDDTAGRQTRVFFCVRCVRVYVWGLAYVVSATAQDFT